MSPQEYTIEQVNPMMDKETNQQRTDKYGNLRYYVKFQGEADSVPLSAKVKPEIGSTKYGSIETGEYGRYFKSAQNPSSPRGGSKYDSDGQKQGMAIKSAADYVTKHSTEKLTPELFGKAVEAYATVLYNLDLKKVKPAPQSWEEMRAKKDEIIERKEQEEQAQEELGRQVAKMIDEGSEITTEQLAAIPF